MLRKSYRDFLVHVSCCFYRQFRLWRIRAASVALITNGSSEHFSSNRPHARHADQAIDLRIAFFVLQTGTGHEIVAFGKAEGIDRWAQNCRCPVPIAHSSRYVAP